MGILVENGFDDSLCLRALKALSLGQTESSRQSDSADLPDDIGSVQRECVDSRQNCAPADLLSVVGARKCASRKVELFVLDDFLSAQECIELIRKVTKGLRPSMVSVGDSVERSACRTSLTCDLAPGDCALVDEVEQRMATLLGLPLEGSEDLQAQFYGTGDEFKHHTDCFDPKSAGYQGLVAHS